MRNISLLASNKWIQIQKYRLVIAKTGRKTKYTVILEAFGLLALKELRK